MTDGAVLIRWYIPQMDKANVLEVSILWREVVARVGQDYADVALSDMYVDN